MRTVAILCAAKKSVYHGMPDLEVFDEARDARTFQGGMPIIAHPPCRYWIGGLFGKQARDAADPAQVAVEKELGLWCVEQIKRCGGILEQPAKSALWDAAALPRPGGRLNRDGFSLCVYQRWWGLPMRKATWLYFVGIDPAKIEIQYRLQTNRGPAKLRGGRKLYSALRCHIHKTTPAFAGWLVNLARQATL